VDIFCKDYL